MYFIYKISIQDTPHVYIGSTLNYNKRMSQHKQNINDMGLDYKLYQKMREHGLEKCKFELVESIDCEKDGALTREQYWIEQCSADLNETSSKRTKTIKQSQAEYYDTHREAVAKKNKEYVQRNKEAVAAKKKEWYEKNKERILAERKAAYEAQKSLPNV